MNPDAEAFRSMRSSVLALARDHADELDRVCAATPAWRARDVLSHLGGVCDDVVHGNLTDVGSDAWTGAQVDKRRGWTVDAILDDWSQGGEAVDVMIDQAPDGTFGQLLFDAWTHEQDLRGGLDVPGGRESAAAQRAFDWAIMRLDLREQEAQRPALELRTEDGTRTVGAGEPASALRTARFELMRAMTGRRSVAQIHAYEWTGDADPDRLVLAAFFHPPAADLRE